MSSVSLLGIAKEFEELWGIPGLSRDLRIEFSSRMSSTLGRCIPARRVIRLNESSVPPSPELVREVLCHELAHLAVYLVHGAEAKAHGPEWRSLVIQAGYPAGRRLAVATTGASKASPPRARRWYEHRCPVCQAVRLAKTAAPRWKCSECVADGLSGEMVVAPLGARRDEEP